jgi:sialic acid synthase SpsE
MTYIIAEAGINHNGDLAHALGLARAAKDAGADAVKYQMYTTDQICRHDNPEYLHLRSCELCDEHWSILRDYCERIWIDFGATPDTAQDVERLMKLRPNFLKIGSGGLDNVDLLAAANESGLPVYMSTGMSDAARIAKARRTLTIVFCEMHCVSAYPLSPDDANMRRMMRLGRFGFSDHSRGEHLAIMAVAMGALAIEKHMTLDNNMDGPDHRMSLDPLDFRRYVQHIRSAEKSMGDGVFRVCDAEQQTIQQLKDRT